jgi:hypothetical protein
MTIIFQYSYFWNTARNIFDNRYIETDLWATSGIPVIIKLKPDSRETKTEHVQSNLRDLGLVYLDMPPE